jgi:hypothetical protein
MNSAVRSIRRLRRAPRLVVLVLGCGLACGAPVLAAAPRDSIEAPLAPWRPIAGDGDSLALTDKSVTLAANGLPARIAVADVELLAAPLEVDFPTGTPGPGTADGNWRSPAGDFAGAARSVTIVDGAERGAVRVEAEFAFDGLMTWTVSSGRPPRGWVGRDVRFRLRLAPGLARLMHRYGPVGARNVDLDAAGRNEFRSAYLPFLWLGDDERGLFWLSERWFGPERQSLNDTLTVRRDGQGWTVEWKVPVTAAGPWRHSFSLMPTPVKPLERDWRTRRMWPASRATSYVIWPDETGFDAPYFGYPESRNPRGLRDYLSAQRRGGRAGAPYACPTWVSTQVPGWAQRAAEWGRGPRESQEGSRWGGAFVHACPNSASWRGLAATAFTKFIDDYRLSAIYMDNAQAYATRGCVSATPGDGTVEYPMLAQRDTYRAIVARLRRHAARSDAIVHSSGGINLPSFSVADSLLTGEQYRGVVGADYLDVASLTDFRVELNSRRWGIVTHFLPEFPENVRDAVAPTRKLMSILLLHDARPWPKWSNVAEVNRGLDALDAFDVRAARFVPYYADERLADARDGRLLVSGYQDGERALLIAANLAKAPARERLCLAARLRAATTRVERWPARTPVAFRDGCVDLEVDAGAYAMLRVVAAPRDPAVR